MSAAETATTSPVTRLLSEVSAAVQQHYERPLTALGERLLFDRPPDPRQWSGEPVVLLLGNHSSGKSTLINHLLGIRVQTTGVAPTDDSFTIISYSRVDDEQDGAALVGDPARGFAHLERFGPSLVGHLRLKLRDADILEELTLIDSPGMIDSLEDVDRGYDFLNVVRELAFRADLILLLFDPDKPGTTGETMEVLTQSLQGLHHKVLFCFHKVDRFESIHDFARAYGALCWNLGKAIHVKDMPRIYTTFVRGSQTRQLPGLPLHDFDKNRDEVLGEVRAAPRRRLDNIVTGLNEHTRRLRMHLAVIGEVRARFKRTQRQWWAGGAGTPLFLFLTGFGLFELLGDPLILIVCTALAIVFGLMVRFIGQRYLNGYAEELVEGLGAAFEKVHARELALGDRRDDLEAIWAGLQDRTRHAIRAIGVPALPRIKASELAELDRILDEEVPRLRQRIRAELDGD